MDLMRPVPAAAGAAWPSWWMPRRRAVAELAAGGATLGAWLVAEALGLKVFAFFVLLSAWVGYFLVRGLRRPDLWREWGVHATDWRRALRWHGGAAILALAVVGAIGAVRSTFALPTYLWALVLMYPAWAFCQQFVLQNGVVANLSRLGVGRRWLPLAGMLVFGAAHLPDWQLAGLTAMGGLLWTWLWLRARNLWLLALGHAVVGSIAFLWVLDRDPVLEFPQVASWVAGL